MTKQPKSKSPSKQKSIQLQTDNARSAGILLHISSLPSPFGIGDLGPEAEKFADFLSQSGQRYWQVLPLNPTGEDQAYSPYSAVSAMAGNPLLISPEKMASDEWITPQEIKKFHVDRKSTRLNSSHVKISYAVFCLK